MIYAPLPITAKEGMEQPVRLLDALHRATCALEFYTGAAFSAGKIFGSTALKRKRTSPA